MNRRTALGSLAALAVTTACRRGPLRTIRVGSLPRYTLAPLYLADERGYFRDVGLAVDAQLVTDTTQTVPLLAAGQIDVSLAGATPALFNAVAQGARVRIVAAREIAVPGCTREVHGYRATFSNGFEDPAQLKGKRVAVTAPTSLTAYLLDVLLDAANLKTSDVQLWSMRLSESALALVAGRLDAVVDLDMGFSSPDVIAGPSVATIIPGFHYSYLHFGAALVDGDVSVGAAFLDAYYRGVRDFLGGQEPQAMARLAESSGMDLATVRTACRERLSATGAITSDSVQRMLDWSARKSFLRTSVALDQIVDRRFLEAATG